MAGEVPWWARDDAYEYPPPPGEPPSSLWDDAPPEPTPAPHRHDAGRRVTAAFAALLLLGGAVLGGAVTSLLRGTATFEHPSALPGVTQPRPPSDGTGTGPADAASVGRTVARGVVDINTWIGYEQAQAAGTGMLLTADGEVLTNNHVITGATRIRVTAVANGRTYDARVVGYDRTHDVAVLHLVGAQDLPTVTIGSSAGVRVGQAVVAVGNAGGRGGEPDYAGGTVTALDQAITASDSSDGTSEQLTGLIEVDANVVPGDSGGPLADQQGRVIGMNTAASAGFRFRSSTGDAFAVPIDTALRIARQIESGTPSATVHVGPTALLGVAASTTPQGVVVAEVVNGGPADRAGLEAGDILLTVDGEPVRTSNDLAGVMVREHPGDRVTVQYVDPYGQQGSVTVRLGSGPPQ